MLEYNTYLYTYACVCMYCYSRCCISHGVAIVDCTFACLPDLPLGAMPVGEGRDGEGEGEQVGRREGSGGEKEGRNALH